MDIIRITNINENVQANFSYKEFWKPRFGGGIDFDMPKCLVDAAQIMRDEWGIINITSTIRPNDTFGYHKNGNACDYLPKDYSKIKQFQIECMNYQNGKGSEIIKKLREAGVQGFGIEAGNCIHLDFRNDKNCSSTDEYGKYIVFSWVADGTKYGKSVVYPRK